MSTLASAAQTARRRSVVARVPTAVLMAVAAVLLALLFIGPLWDADGLPNTADGILHIHRAAEMARAWTEGVVWPRWYAGGYEGLGIPLFHYYSPLFYELVAPLHLLLIPLDPAAKMVLTLFCLLSAAALFGWLRRLFSPAAAIAGAALYLAGPHFFREYYFQGDYPQTIALFWLPVVLWAITRLHDDGRPCNWLAATGSVAVLAVAHNITAMLGAVFLAAYWLTLPLWRRSWAGWIRTAAAALLGLGLSAFFWLPALADLGYVRVDTLRGAFFRFARYFVFPADLLAAPPQLDLRAANPPFPYLLGWAAWAALAAGVVVLVVAVLRRGRFLRRARFLLRARFLRPARFLPPARFLRSALGAGLGLLIAGVCLALTQAWTAPVWERLPGLALLQFPGRLLGPAALAAALTGAAAVNAIRPGQWRTAALAVTLGGAALCSAVFLFPRLPFLSLTRFSLADTQAFERTTGNWGLTSTSGYLPRWATPPGADDQQPVPVVELPPLTHWQWATPERAMLQSDTQDPLPAGQLILPLHYFPAWEVRVNGTALSAEPTDQGLTRVTLPGGATQVDVVWRGTAWERRGRWVSLASLLILGAALAPMIRRQHAGRLNPRKQARDAADGAADAGRQRPAILLAVGLLFVLVAARYAIRLFDLGWFQTVSAPDAVAHTAHPLQVQFTSAGGSQVSLLGWDILPDSDPQPGGVLRVRLYWQGRGAIPENLHSFAHLVTTTPDRSWAVVQNEAPGSTPTARWNSALYTVDDLILRLPLDLPPITYTLAVGLVDPAGQRLSMTAGGSLASLTNVAIAPLTAGRHQAQQPDVLTEAQFGDRLKLQGYTVEQEAAPAGAGAQTTLTLFWQVLSQPGDDPDASVFIHVVDETGALLAQFDGPLAEGLPVLAASPAGSLIIDKHAFTLDATARAHGRSILVGLYDRGAMARWPVAPSAAAAAHFTADGSLTIPLQNR